MTLRFAIAWSTTDASWAEARAKCSQHAPGSEYDRALYALDELVIGRVWFEQAGQPMMPTYVPAPNWTTSVWSPDDRLAAKTPRQTQFAHGFAVSLVDFTWQLADILVASGFDMAPDGTSAFFHEAAEALMLEFHKHEGSIRILSNTPQDRGWLLEVPESEFFAAVHWLLKSFVTAVAQHAPVLLEWQTFRPLLPYLNSDPSLGPGYPPNSVIDG